jgi:hypothetical protein
MLGRKEIDRTTIIENLTKGICKIIFRKATDGRFRSMICTLNTSYIPTKFERGVKEVLGKNPDRVDLIPVYDIIKDDWRSFYINTIQIFYTPEDLKENKEVTRLRKQKEKENENNRE